MMLGYAKSVPQLDVLVSFVAFTICKFELNTKIESLLPQYTGHVGNDRNLNIMPLKISLENFKNHTCKKGIAKVDLIFC